MNSNATIAPSAHALRFKVEGLDCQNEVQILRTALGPIVGGHEKLSFDTKTGTMDVPGEVSTSVEDIERAVASTGMRAIPLPALVALRTGPADDVACGCGDAVNAVSRRACLGSSTCRHDLPHPGDGLCRRGGGPSARSRAARGR
jgi:hypothetical protein